MTPLQPTNQTQARRTGSARSAARAGVVAVAALAAVMGLSACESGQLAASARPAVVAGWPFWPTQMRVHPLTRILRAPEATVAILDLRVEATDFDGVEGRVAGVLTIEVISRQRGAEGARSTVTETIDLMDPVANRRTFDRVTRTYHVLITLDWPEPPESGSAIDIAATLEGADGRTLRARGQVRWP